MIFVMKSILWSGICHEVNFGTSASTPIATLPCQCTRHQERRRKKKTIWTSKVKGNPGNFCEPAKGEILTRLIKWQISFSQKCYHRFFRFLFAKLFFPSLVPKLNLGEFDEFECKRHRTSLVPTGASFIQFTRKSEIAGLFKKLHDFPAQDLL